MEPNTDRMSMSIVVLLIAGALAGALLTPGLPKLVGLYSGAGNVNFLQWIFSMIGTNFKDLINTDTTNGTLGLISMFRF